MFWTFLCGKAGRDLKTDFYVSRRSIFLLKTWNNPNFLCFLYSQRKKFARTFWQGCQKCTCIDHKTFSGKLFLWSFVFFCFCDFEWIGLCLLAKEAYEVVKPSSYVSRRAFFLLMKPKNAQMFTFFVLTANTNLRKLFGRLVNSIFVLSTVTYLGKLVFWRVFFLFEILRVSFLFYDRTSSAKL